jgi:hypothetical protein
MLTPGTYGGQPTPGQDAVHSGNTHPAESVLGGSGLGKEPYA